jgi:hypothetical protein
MTWNCPLEGSMGTEVIDEGNKSKQSIKRHSPKKKTLTEYKN